MAQCSSISLLPEAGPLDALIGEGLVQAFVAPVPPAGCRIRVHFAPQAWESDLACHGDRLHTTQPGQYVGRKHGNSCAGCHVCQCFLSAWFSVGKLIAANHDGDQVCHLGDGSGEDGLKSGRRACRLPARQRPQEQ